MKLLFPFSPHQLFASICPEIPVSLAGKGVAQHWAGFPLSGEIFADLFCSPRSQQIPKTTVSGFV